MELTKCPACEHEVSMDAMSCPNCGHQLKKPEHKFNIWALLLAILVVGLVVYYILPINHIVPLTSAPAAQQTVIAEQEPVAVQANDFEYYLSDDLLVSVDTTMAGQKICVKGMVLGVEESYFTLMSTSGAETTARIVVFFEPEFYSVYNLGYGDEVIVWLQCNDVNEYYGYQCDLIAFNA